MTSVERKIVHLRLKEFEGVGTESEGAEPNRHVVVDSRPWGFRRHRGVKRETPRGAAWVLPSGARVAGVASQPWTIPTPPGAARRRRAHGGGRDRPTARPVAGRRRVGRRITWDPGRNRDGDPDRAARVPGAQVASSCGRGRRNCSSTAEVVTARSEDHRPRCRPGRATTWCSRERSRHHRWQSSCACHWCAPAAGWCFGRLPSRPTDCEPVAASLGGSACRNCAR